MKFYEKIIGINVDNSIQEYTLTFNNSGFVFDKDITALNFISSGDIAAANGVLIGKELKILSGDSLGNIEFKKSGLDWIWEYQETEFLHWKFSTLTWNFANNTILDNIKSVLPGGTSALGSSSKRWTNIYATDLNATSATINNLQATWSQKTTLLKDSSVRVSGWTAPPIGGIETFKNGSEASIKGVRLSSAGSIKDNGQPLNEGGQWIIYSGTMQAAGASGSAGSKTISFSPAFTNTPVVVITPYAEADADASVNIKNGTLTGSSVTYQYNSACIGIHYIAMGWKNY